MIALIVAALLLFHAVPRLDAHPIMPSTYAELAIGGVLLLMGLIAELREGDDL